MGIDKLGFTENIEISIAKFYCGVCDDVVSDPILTKDCEHYVCRTCVNDDKNICSTCGTKINGYDELSVALRRIHSSIKLKCIYDKCTESLLTIENYTQHEQKCPAGFYKCPKFCGFKIRLSVDDAQRVHNCIDVLRNKVVALEETVAELRSSSETLIVQNKELETENLRLGKGANEGMKKRAKCGIVLFEGDKFYRCFTCQVRRISVICVNCFENGQHTGHRYTLLVAQKNTGWYCDCGDTETLQPDTAACSIHKLN